MEENFCYIFNIQSPYFIPLTLVLYPDIGVALIKIQAIIMIVIIPDVFSHLFTKNN